VQLPIQIISVTAAVPVLQYRQSKAMAQWIALMDLMNVIVVSTKLLPCVGNLIIFVSP